MDNNVKLAIENELTTSLDAVLSGKKIFRMASKSFFLTYPQCPITKEEALAMLKAKLAPKPIRGIVVAAELHEDGSPHLHAYILLEKQLETVNPRYWDLGEYHGNYQKARDINAVVKYIKKDGNIIEEGDISWAEKVDAKADHRKAMFSSLLDKSMSLTEAVQQDPSLLRDYQKLKINLAAYHADLAPTKAPCVGFIPNTWGLLMPILPAKQRHYWVWSAQPNRGKSTKFLDPLAEQYPSMRYNWNEKFQNPSPPAQFVILDEYSIPVLTVTQLNLMCDGQYDYPVKGGMSFKQPGSILLICGNRSPLEIYDSKHHAVLQARFNIICVDIEAPAPTEFKFTSDLDSPLRWKVNKNR